MLGLTEKPDREPTEQPVTERKAKKKPPKKKEPKKVVKPAKKREEKPKIAYVDSSYYTSRAPKKAPVSDSEWV